MKKNGQEYHYSQSLKLKNYLGNSEVRSEIKILLVYPPELIDQKPFLKELMEGFSTVNDLGLVKLKSLNKDSGKASAQKPVSINAPRLILLEISHEHKIGFLHLMEEQHTFPADPRMKINYMCLAFATGLSAQVWAFDPCAA